MLYIQYNKEHLCSTHSSSKVNIRICQPVVQFFFVYGQRDSSVGRVVVFTQFPVQATCWGLLGLETKMLYCRKALFGSCPTTNAPRGSIKCLLLLLVWDLYLCKHSPLNIVHTATLPCYFLVLFTSCLMKTTSFQVLLLSL